MDFVPLHPDCIPESLYLHYPLCKHHCSYCDFNVVVAQTRPADYEKQWIGAVERQLGHWIASGRGNLKTLYMGGGTPSLMNVEALKKLCVLLDRFYYWQVDEWTIECNPETLTRDKLEAMRDLGINRLSVGVQTFNPAQLRRLERLATHNHIEKILVDVQNLFINFSVDLMIGIPDQTLETLEHDLEKISKLKPPHISVYLLTLDADHKLKTKTSMAPRIASDQLASEMYLKVCEALDGLGYDHYEVSNFALPGFRSQHNSNYWNPSRGYLGLGPGAHGYLCLGSRRVRYENIRDPSDWAEHQNGVENFENLTEEQKRIEELYLKLRTRKPVMIREINESFARAAAQNGLIEFTQDGIRLTRSGWLIIESLAARLIS